MAEITYREALNRTLFEEMRRDESVIVLGEDVAEYGGSFKVTKGLLEEFGEDRVIDTPISEAAIIGMATGAAMGGLRPVPELMTVNFAYVAMDQLCNHLNLMRYMFGGQVTLPVTVRMPGGGGHQLGSQHSNSLEAYFVHTPGLKVVYASRPVNAASLLQAAIRDDDPVIFLEHEGLYNLKGEVPDEVGPARIGRAEIVREGADATIVAYGGMLHPAMEAAGQLEEEGTDAEVIDLLTLYPWDKAAVAESASKTGRVVVVEEPPDPCGIGAEVATNVYERCFADLAGPVRRVSGADAPLPYSRDLEQACIPHAEDVVRAVRECLD
ncbi:MAG: alpha-ketoacid dehydrogenase subunit beta [Planctomycetota bacterium]